VRPRLAVPASLLAVLVAAVLPSVGSAAPKHNHGLTINATPNPIVTGDQVLIYGQLNLKHPGNRLIVLFHRVNPSKQFSPVQTTHTNAVGFYEFPRADGVVTTNRNWFVLGPNGTHSRTVHELVAAQVTLAASSATGDTNHKLTFSGSVAPNHAGERVVLQSQVGLKGDDWRDVASGRIGPGSNYSISHRFLQPGDRDLRVLFAGDARNVRAVSDPVTVTIQQMQNATFTINASSQNIDEGSNVTISGVLYAKGSTSTPAGGQAVQLWGHQANAPYKEIGSATTDPTTGAYSFTASPTHNEVYEVRTAMAPLRRTAQVFEGVRDVVSISASSSSATVGEKVLFTGVVAPDKTGHVIYLQRLGADNDWHTVKESRVLAGSTYSIGWTLGYPGAKQFRTLVPGGDYNTSGHSAPVTVTAVLAVSSLPPAP
jgi:phage protein U